MTAGYTLAAGPVRADVIKTDTTGLTAGDVKIKVADGEMPGYSRDGRRRNPPWCWWRWRFSACTNISGRDAAPRQLGALAVAPDYYFRKGADLTKITEISQLMPIVNSKPDAELLSDLDGTVVLGQSQAAIPRGSASSGSAAAGGRSGNMPPIAVRSRRAPRSTVR